MVGGDNDLTMATLNVEAVRYTGDATLTLTADQIADIGIVDADGDGVADNWTVAAGATVVLNIVDLTDQPLDLDAIAAAGIDIGSISIENTDAPVTLHPLTTLGGADVIYMPTADGEDMGEAVEKTSLNLTAAQFAGLDGAGSITEEGGVVDPSTSGTVNITDLMNTLDTDGDGDVDATTIDLSGVVVRNGTITINELANDVTLDAASNLNSSLSPDPDVPNRFSVTLNDVDSSANPDDLAGQTIRFSTAVQAERAILVDGYDGSHEQADTNVIWLFDTIDGTAEAGKVDTAGYDGELGRLWVNDQLVDGENVEELFTSLAQSIVIRVVNTADLDELLPIFEGVDRTVEVESFTQLPGGLSFNDEDLLEGVVNLTLDLGGDVEMGDLAIDNIVAADVLNPGGADFQTLTINSLLANPAVGPDAALYLLPEDFDPLVNPYPTGPNVIGDISAGPTREQLDDVTLNATQVGLDIQTIYFVSDEAGTVATLTVTGNRNTTIKSVDSSDADVTGVVIAKSGAGVLTITGGSPAAALGDTEELTITGNGTGDIKLGTAADTANSVMYAGIAGAALSLVTVSAAAAVDLGVIAEVDSAEFTLTDTNGAATTTLVMGEANANGLKAPELAADGVWTFNSVTMTLTGDVTLGAGTLVLNNVALTIDGDVDFSTLAEDDPATPEQEGLVLIGGTTIDVPTGASLTLTAVQADGLVITGGGSVDILALEETPNADLSGIFTGVDDTGTVTAALDSTDDVTLGGDLGKAAITISGNGTVDITGNINEASFTVGADATLAVTAAQADGLVADGTGTVAIGDLGQTPDADLSGITATTVTAAVDTDVTFTGDLGTGVTVVVGDGVTLTAEASVVDGQTIENAVDGDGRTLSGSLVVEDNAAGDPIDADLSNVETNIAFGAGVELGTVTFPTLTTVDNDPDPDFVQTVTLTAAQASGQTINGGASGQVIITELGADPVDFTGINVDDATATVPATATLDATTDLGDVNVVVAAGVLTLTGAQASGLSITGAGSVIITDVAAGDDLTGIDVAGGLTIQAAEGETELTLTAEQADGAIVEGFLGATLDKVTVTALEDALGTDLSGINATDVEVQLDSTGDVEIAGTANLAGATVIVSGNGIVTAQADDPATSGSRRTA